MPAYRQYVGLILIDSIMTTEIKDIGIVYVLSNPCFKYFDSFSSPYNSHLIKIGMTRRTLQERMNELNTSGVPAPFVCEYAARVENPEWVENVLHNLFDEFRLSKSREFFNVHPVVVKQALQLREHVDVLKEQEEARGDSWLDDDF